MGKPLFKVSDGGYDEIVRVTVSDKAYTLEPMDP